VLGHEDWRGAMADINEDGLCVLSKVYVLLRKASSLDEGNRFERLNRPPSVTLSLTSDMNASSCLHFSQKAALAVIP
ncbi:hypothetical protein Tco_0120963, partial [Tanacetum coccineum]